MQFGNKPQFPASVTGSASFNIAPGVAPSTPVDGDVWATTAGLFARLGTVTGQFAITDASGSLRIKTTGATGTYISAHSPTGYGAAMQFFTGESIRWQFGKGPTDETGANAGSEFALYRYADDGSYLGRVFSVGRASGDITFDKGMFVSGRANFAWGANIASTTVEANPIHGDTWINTTGFFARMNGVTYQVALIGHGHAIADVSGLQNALNAKLDKTGGTLTGNIRVAMGASEANISVDSDPAVHGFFQILTNNVFRWRLGKTNSAEPGSNAGGDFGLYRYSDTGTYLGRPLYISRATGDMIFEGTVNISGKLNTSASTVDRASANIAPGVAPSAPANGDLWSTAAGFYVRVAGVTHQLATATHTHDAAVLTSGTIDDARLPTRLGTFCRTITDWNYAATNGFFMGSAALNAPEATGWFMGYVVAHNTLYATQTVHGFSGDTKWDGKIWRRSMNNGTWDAWYRVRDSEAELDTIYARLASPALTGIPTAPTAGSGTNTTQLATTQFVRQEIAALVASSPGTLDTLSELATALGNDPNFATTISGQIGGKLGLAGGTMTGLLATVASATGGAGFRLPHGAAPTAPVNGDLWTTTAGFFAYINGVVRGFVDTARTISAGSGLSGGGDLSANRSLSIATGGVTLAMIATAALSTVAGVRAATTGLLAQVKDWWDAAAIVTLTINTGAVTPDFGAGWNFSLLMTANATLNAPQNPKVGQTGVIVVTQDGTGGKQLAYNSAWKFVGGVPSLSAGAGVSDYLYYWVESSGRIIAHLSKAPA